MLLPRALIFSSKLTLQEAPAASVRVVAGVKVIKFVLAAEFQVTPQVVVMLPTKLTVVSSAVGQGNVVLFKQLRFCLKSVTVKLVALVLSMVFLIVTVSPTLKGPLFVVPAGFLNHGGQRAAA